MDGPKGSTRFSSREATSLIAELARSQYGVVARRQLLEAGLPHRLIAGRVVNGRLVPIFRGVYAVGTSSLDRQGRWLATTLAAGPNALLSHKSAAALHGLIAPRTGPIEVVRGSGSRGRLVSKPAVGVSGFEGKIHRSVQLPDRDRSEIDGIPVTSVARTFLDLAANATQTQLSTALSEAERRRSVSQSELAEVAGRGRGWSGTENLRQALQGWLPLEAESRSELEAAFLRLCRSHGIPLPVVNTTVGDFVVDFLWRSERLVIEVDGFAFHGDVKTFKSDRDRDIDLALEGFRVARLTYDSIFKEQSRTAARVHGLLNLCRRQI